MDAEFLRELFAEFGPITVRRMFSGAGVYADGVIIALVILLPEGISAVRAAQRNHIQTSLNLGLGSAMASIGLTIPAVAVASIWMPGQLVLGLGETQIVLLLLSIVVSILTVVPGRATKLQGGVHLVIFAAFLFLSVSP